MGASAASAVSVVPTGSGAPTGTASAPSTWIETRGAPTRTTSPSPPCRRSTTPAQGDGISTSAFAVFTSTKTWFSTTVSPSATRHATISASSRPSPRSGSRKSRVVIARRRLQYVNTRSTASRMRSTLGRKCDSSVAGGYGVS